MGKIFAWRIPVRIIASRMPQRPRIVRRRAEARPFRVRFGGSKAAVMAAILLFGVAAGGCEGDAGRGALIGGGLGLAGGTIIGHQSGHAAEGALIGGALGAATGSAIGAQRDLARERDRGRYAYEEGYHHGYDEGYYAERRQRRHKHDDYCDH
jgi:hypothetical protein